MPIGIHDNTFTKNVNAIYHDGQETSITAGNTFDTVDSTIASKQQLLTIEDNIHDGLDEVGKGFIVLQTNTEFVSPGGDINAAIAAASPGDMVFIGAGTYSDPLVIAKDISLGAQGVVTLSGGIDLHGHLLKLYSDGGGQLESSGIISDSVGTGQLWVSGGTAKFDEIGANTYTGDTTVVGAELDLASDGNAIPGNLVILGGGTVNLLADEQIVDSADVSVDMFGAFNLNHHTETLDPLSLSGGTIDLSSK